MSKRRIVPTLEVRATELHCDPHCMYLQGGPRIPRCLLFTGTLDDDGRRVARADECKDAETRSLESATRKKAAK